MSLKCINHVDRVTEVACSKCNNGICGKCRVPKGSRYLCVECFKESEKSLERDLPLENKILVVGALSIILGIVFFVWGLCSHFGWSPPTRFNTLAEREGPIFMAFGLVSLLTGAGLYSLSGLARILQILLSFGGILGIMTLHPIAIVASLVHLYILSVLIFPQTGKAFSSEYSQLITEEDIKKNLTGIFYAIKLPVFILFTFIGTFLMIVVFVLIFALQPSYYAPTAVYFVKGAEKVVPKDLQAGNFYKISFSYEHQKVYPNYLFYQVLVDGHLTGKGRLLPSPEEKKGSLQVPGLWKALPGPHEIKVMLHRDKTASQYKAAHFNLAFDVLAPVKEKPKEKK